MTAPLPTVLLYEPQFVARRTVAAAARQLGIADVHEAATLQAAFRLAGQHRYDLALVAMEGEPIGELERFAQACNARRIVGVDAAGASTACAGMSGVLRKPLKVKELLAFIKG